MTDEERFEWLTKTAKRSLTGISFDWVPAVDGERSGFRFMRRHWVGEPHDTIREAIDDAAKVQP